MPDTIAELANVSDVVIITVGCSVTMFGVAADISVIIILLTLSIAVTTKRLPLLFLLCRLISRSGSLLVISKVSWLAQLSFQFTVKGTVEHQL